MEIVLVVVNFFWPYFKILLSVGVWSSIQHFPQTTYDNFEYTTCEIQNLSLNL